MTTPSVSVSAHSTRDHDFPVRVGEPELAGHLAVLLLGADVQRLAAEVVVADELHVFALREGRRVVGGCLGCGRRRVVVVPARAEQHDGRCNKCRSGPPAAASPTRLSSHCAPSQSSRPIALFRQKTSPNEKVMPGCARHKSCSPSAMLWRLPHQVSATRGSRYI